MIDVLPWEPGKTEASQERSTPVEACSLWETELITHRKGLAESALVILSKQDKHTRWQIFVGSLTGLPLSFVG